MREVSLAPDHRTKELIDRYGLQESQINGVYSLFSTMNRDKTKFLAYLRCLLGAQPLCFSMISSNPNFAIISDLPVRWCGQLAYSSYAVESNYDSSQNTKKLTMKLSKKTSWYADAVGQISIYLDDLIEEDGTIRDQDYSVTMNARLTYWCYYVINRNNIRISIPKVTNHSGIVFDGPKSVEIANGETAMMYTSGSMQFPFAESPKHKFDLINFPSRRPNSNGTAKSKGRTLIRGLPVPRGNSINIRSPNGGRSVYSDMYVYL